MPLITIEWKVSFRLIDNNIMNLTRANFRAFFVKVLHPGRRLFTPSCHWKFSWNDGRRRLFGKLFLLVRQLLLFRDWFQLESLLWFHTNIQQLSAALPLFYLSGTFRSFLIKKIVLDQGANIFEALVSQEHVNVSSWSNTCANRNMKIFSQ